jgi:teichuronic acid biosynthesis glycosyltransferase TuaG
MIMNRPEISIITPAYNSEEFIAKTIESVIEQTFSSWEMIIVDDGSTDETSNIVKSFSDSDRRIRYFRLDRNSGRPSVPRNHAIFQSRGDYLAFLDSDDIWMPEKLGYQLRYMKENDLEFCYGPTLTSGGKHLGSGRLRSRGDLIKHNFIPCLTVMMRKREKYLPVFDEEPYLKASEDYFAWLKIYRMTDRVGCYDKCLSRYRTDRNDNILREYHRDPHQRMAKEYLFYSKAYLGGALTRREAVAAYCRILFRNLIRNKLKRMLSAFIRPSS